MSPTIWTQCGARRRARPLELEAWRVVESQYVVSTRKLVDSDAEQQLLEELIDSAKPPVPDGLQSLHYLLSTPFRHPPLRNGSRFGTRHERGIFYGSVEVETAVAEVAYYRLLFLDGTEAELGLLQTEHTGFRVAVRTKVGIDLTKRPFADHVERISSPMDYSHAQALGREMRADGVEVALFASARDPERRANVALFEPAFARRKPFADAQTWLCAATRERVELRRKNLFTRADALVFLREAFLVDGALPAPAA